MAGKRRKKRQLPRITLLAYSAADLLRFTESVERLSCLVNDLAVAVAELKVKKPRKAKAHSSTLGGADSE